jgi:carbonic anhydrase
VRIPVRNHLTFPFVQKAVVARHLQLHGWYFDLDGGELRGCDPASGRFRLLSDVSRVDWPEVPTTQTP